MKTNKAMFAVMVMMLGLLASVASAGEFITVTSSKTTVDVSGDSGVTLTVNLSGVGTIGGDTLDATGVMVDIYLQLPSGTVMGPFAVPMGDVSDVKIADTLSASNVGTRTYGGYIFYPSGSGSLDFSSALLKSEGTLTVTDSGSSSGYSEEYVQTLNSQITSLQTQVTSLQDQLDNCGDTGTTPTVAECHEVLLGSNDSLPYLLTTDTVDPSNKSMWGEIVSDPSLPYVLRRYGKKLPTVMGINGTQYKDAYVITDKNGNLVDLGTVTVYKYFQFTEHAEDGFLLASKEEINISDFYIGHPEHSSQHAGILKIENWLDDGAGNRVLYHTTTTYFSTSASSLGPRSKELHYEYQDNYSDQAEVQIEDSDSVSAAIDELYWRTH